jgi:hypothetical protein
MEYEGSYCGWLCHVKEGNVFLDLSALSNRYLVASRTVLGCETNAKVSYGTV